MLLIQDKKNIDIMKVSGNGERDGEVRPWPLKDLAVQVVRLMDIVIDFILLLFIRI